DLLELLLFRAGPVHEAKAVQAAISVTVAAGAQADIGAEAAGVDGRNLDRLVRAVLHRAFQVGVTRFERVALLHREPQLHVEARVADALDPFDFLFVVRFAVGAEDIVEPDLRLLIVLLLPGIPWIDRLRLARDEAPAIGARVGLL